ncbi:Y_Y_Y domain-containing protein [Saccharicrinis carchari]|uniref:Y_Y_Y domain-containing protein n=2 Tax=Saccharicrinis carchari TaxID=1168039 RepID=A0A521BAF0_SACCC|nr:Y_Y_Y domain-containing protein [Saccharicrinis carchari]
MYAQIQKIGIPEIEYFNRRQYAGATQNWDIQQASTGFVYFANNECLLEYDGVNWNMIDRMSGNIVRSVSEIGNRLYTGSFEEFGYFEYDSIQQLSYNSLWDKDIPEGLGDIWDIHSWNGEVVLRTEHSLVFINNDKLAKIISAPLRFTSSYVVNGLLLVHDEEEGLMEVRGDKVFPVAGGEVFIGKEITSILPASDNSFVIGTIRAGLFLWDMRGVVKWNVEADPLLKITNIFCGLKYNNDFMVFGTIQGGVVVVDMQGKVFMQIDKDKGLNNNTVLSLTVDREGNIWGGLDNGIVRINFNSSVSFLQGYYNLGTGYCLEKYNDDLYFGTNQALFKISASKFSDPLKTRDDFKRLANTDGQVWALYHDQNSLLCGHNFGAFDISNGTAKKITPGGINGVWNFKPVPGRPDLILSGTYQGICVFQKREGKWLFKSKIEGFDESSRYMEWDDKGNLWVSHGFKGVFSLRFDNDFTAVTRADSFTRDSFPGNRASLVLSKVRGMCVFSGFDGIYRLASDSSTFEREELYDAFFDAGRFPKFLKEDKYNNIWYFSDNSVGVLRYMEDGTYRKVVNPFLPLERKLVGGFEFVFVQDRQNALFGIEDGFAHYSSYDKKNYQIPFNVHVRSFKELSDTISYSFNSVKSGPLPQIVMPVFKFRNNTFDVSYAASFLEGSGMRYSTYLKGFDQAYSDWSESKTRTFANLHEGIYTFGVKAKNRYGVEAEPVYFSFEVLPPWYRTLYAKMAYLLLSIGLILILMFFINRRIVLSRLKEEAKQKEHFRAKEEQLKNAALLSEKEMIKMRNDKLRSEIVYKKKELANSALHLIQKNEVLSDIKLRLKKISKVPAASGINNEVNAIIKKINRELVDENNWDVFEMHFDQVHEEFLRKLTQQHPDLSQREQKLSAFIKMGMSSKEIAALMNVTTRAVENNRYKLRLKLGLDKGDNLSAYIASL